MIHVGVDRCMRFWSWSEGVARDMYGSLQCSGVVVFIRGHNL